MRPRCESASLRLRGSDSRSWWRSSACTAKPLICPASHKATQDTASLAIKQALFKQHRFLLPAVPALRSLGEAVGDRGLEPRTSSLSVTRSNQLS